MRFWNGDLRCRGSQSISLALDVIWLAGYLWSLEKEGVLQCPFGLVVTSNG